MDARFRHYLKLSTAVHLGLLVVMIVSPLLFSWRLRRKNKQFIQFVDLTVAVPDIPSVKPAESIKPPAPEPPKPVSKDIPEPKIKKSTKKIKRPEPPKPKAPALSQEEIKKLLAAGAKISDRTSIPADEFPFAWYFALVRQTMYDAWNQPSTLSASAGLTTEVTLRVLRDGTITQRKMTRASGNKLMDDSVMKAVEAVPKLRPLPPGFGGSSKDIVIEFELTKDAF